MKKRLAKVLLALTMALSVFPGSLLLARAEELEENSEMEEVQESTWESYTLYNYISLNEGKAYISLNTQENGIRTPKTAEQFHKDNGNKRYDLLTNEYEIADYDRDG